MVSFSDQIYFKSLFEYCLLIIIDCPAVSMDNGYWADYKQKNEL